MVGWNTSSIPSLAGRNAVVTGANSGIGYYTALELAKAGARVTLACRNEARGNEAISSLKAAVPKAELELMLLDVGDLDSVASFADAFLALDRPLHLLVNNAGIMAVPEHTPSKQGFELHVATNHLGAYALTARLLPALRRVTETKPRVVAVGSLAAWKGDYGLKHPVDFKKTPLQASPYDAMARYADSKLANLIFAQELARRHPELVSVAAHPGGSSTNLFASSRMALLKAFMQSPEGGARPTLRAACDPAVVSGDYFGPCTALMGPPTGAVLPTQAKCPEIAARFWAASAEATGLEL